MRTCRTLIFFLSFPLAIAVAQDNKPQQKSKDIDEEITNTKLRVDSGSKSKHSASFSCSYNGGTLEMPFEKNRPNLNSAAATETITSVSGKLNYRYRLTPADSFTIGVGIKWLTPGHTLDKKVSDRSSQQEASNPVVGYDRAFKINDIQNSFGTGFGKISSSNVIEREKTNYYFTMYHAGIFVTPATSWQFGLSSYMDYYNYYSYIPGQVEYDFGFNIVLEYAFNDKYNFRSLYRGNAYYATRDNREALIQAEPTQSTGFGIAVRRDIYLYPNVQWVWRDVRAEKTNIGLTATINI